MAEETGIRITVGLPGLEAARDTLLNLGKSVSAKYQASALKKAAEQGGTKQALRANTPRGPTGNLRRAIAVKTRRYPRSGVGIALIGFQSGRKINEPYDNKKLGYHQGLVEFGTKERFRKTKDGRFVSTGKMPVGGSFGRPPIRTAWEQTRARVEALIVTEFKKAIEAAAREAAYTIKSKERIEGLL